ncbi:hypothetical protein PX52LOC_03814 [Limnoglobus roseus]|uniref:N-acetyltransferase domain-containing protein n=2 Tax=Limnoglobus roseus TaxID=2598579 RepID=A0A5C1AC37_9BACT|nr:hypothetical protein PX52LOC_03814 [Limnoglobus roseus]
MSVAQEILCYQAQLTTALAAIEPLYRRYQRPSADRARIVSLEHVDPHALAAFVVRDVGGLPEEVAARLAGRGRAYCRATSMVALMGDAIVGALLTLRQGHNVFIETRVVDAASRGSHINLALIYKSIAAAVPQGVRTIAFEHDTRERDTAKLARRLGATVVGRRQCWGCEIQQSASETRVNPVESQVQEAVSSDWQADALRDPRVDGLDVKQLQDRLVLDSANDLIQTLSERGVISASIKNRVRGVTLQLKLVRHEAERFDRTTGLKACLLFAVLPRSASIYVFDALAAGLALDKVTVCAHRFPQETINSHAAARLAVPGTICHTHIDARLGNLALINPFLDRMVVHVRDPRQAVLSAVHHMNDLRRRLGAGHVAGFGATFPNHYFDLPFPEQIDFMIAHGLPEFVRWIEGWLAAAANPLFRTKVLFTRYEDLHADPAAYFRSILEFYGVAWVSPAFQPPPAVSGSRHFRKGATDEWRTAFTPAQRDAACAAVPLRVLQRFGWQPH